MTSDELSKMIDLAVDAVDKSKVGPFFVAMPEGKPGISNHAWDTFRIVLNCICPKAMTGEMQIKEPKEPWNQ